MMHSHDFVLLAVLFMAGTLHQGVRGHGYIIEPPGRSSLWRLGYHVPDNYNDNSLRCGGSRTNCGVCGDPFRGPKENEAGGKYAKGIISRTYKQGETIPITVVVTANHMGFFEFHLCPHNDVTTPVTEKCLMQNVLSLEDGSTRFSLPGNKYGRVHLKVKIPDGITCTQCVLRWRWTAGNSWGVDTKTRRGCLGCGPQEQFYGCSDVAISPRENSMGGQGQGQTVPNTGGAPPTQKKSCHAVNNWAGNAELDKWCNVTCNSFTSCPPVFCSCDP